MRCGGGNRPGAGRPGTYLRKSGTSRSSLRLFEDSTTVGSGSTLDFSGSSAVLYAEESSEACVVSVESGPLTGLMEATGATGEATCDCGVSWLAVTGSSKPAAITVTRTSSPRLSEMTAPKMMLASGWATSWT